MAMDAAGDFAIAWVDISPNARESNVYARLYNSLGTPETGQFVVYSNSQFAANSPAVAMDAAGDFIVTFETDVLGYYGSPEDIYAQQYNATGITQGGPFIINSNTAGYHTHPSVAMDALGDFAVTWETYATYSENSSNVSVYARRFNAEGVAEGVDFQVPSTFKTLSNRPSVAMDSAGDFIVAWGAYPSDGTGGNIFAQRYDSSGNTVGNQMHINNSTTNTTVYRVNPEVAMDAAGDFVIAWDSEWQDGSDDGSYARLFNSAGVDQGNEFQVNTYTTASQANSEVAMDAAGNFVVTWVSDHQNTFPSRWTGGADLLAAVPWKLLDSASPFAVLARSRDFHWKPVGSRGALASSDRHERRQSGGCDSRYFKQLPEPHERPRSTEFHEHFKRQGFVDCR